MQKNVCKKYWQKNRKSIKYRQTNIQQTLEKACLSIKTEVGRFNSKHNGSIFKEAEKLHQYGINSKSSKSGKKIVEKTIPVEFLTNDSDDDIN